MGSVTGPSDMWETGGEKMALCLGPQTAATEPTAAPALLHRIGTQPERSVLTRHAPCP